MVRIPITDYFIGAQLSLQLLKNQHSNWHNPKNGGIIMNMATESFTITYTEKDGLLYPDLALPEQSGEDIGRFGRMR